LAYVTITKDLTEVKDKVAFGMTKRQIICFSLAGVTGVGAYFLLRQPLGNDIALLMLIALAAPFMLFGLYEKNGQPLEKILKNIIRVRLIIPAARPYRTQNRFAALERQERYEKEVEQLVSILILSILVDTFLSRISLTMLPAPNLHNTSCVLS